MRRVLTSIKNKKILLVLTAHEQYIKHIDKCIKSINENSNFTNYLLLDNCSYTPKSKAWKVETIKGKLGPNKLRNRAIEIAQELGYEWIVYFDADNLMPNNFGAMVEVKTANAKRKVGVFYNSSPKAYQLEEANYIDTSSAWRVSALVQAGGWDESINSFDDWSVALRIKKLGYIFESLEIAVNRVIHKHNRGSKKSHKEENWKIRSVGVVTLFSGRVECFDKFFNYIENESWPNRVAFYWINNSNDEKFSKKLAQKAFKLINKGINVTVITDNQKCYYNSHKDKTRHEFVCGLYNRNISAVSEELIMFLEDDIIPPLKTYKNLLNNFYPTSKIAAVSASYQTRSNPELCCASATNDSWSNNPKFHELNEPVKIGMIGGGCAIYLNFLVKKCTPFIVTYTKKGSLHGWDCNLSKAIKALGYSIILDGSIKCQHLTPEVINYGLHG